MERIVVYEGDTAEGLAKEFCEKNGLTEDMEEKLKISVEVQSNDGWASETCAKVPVLTVPSFTHKNA